MKMRTERPKKIGTTREIVKTTKADTMGSFNFSDLCNYPNLKVPPKFRCPDLEKYNKTG